MDKKKNKRKGHADLRMWVQLCYSAVTNGYAKGFIEGKIYTGPIKKYCLPGLNCYSCPGALGSCPVGSLQAVLGDRKYNFAFYVVGFLILVGALIGRFVCGWLCPFGLVQDLCHKVPLPKKIKKLKKLPGDRVLRHLKYVILALFVFILPLTVVDIVGQGSPWFCKYICPSGTLLGGIPLVLSNPSLQQALGALFTWKTALLAVFLVLSIFVFRPFCHYICPLGAFYSLFNPISLYRFTIDEHKCTNCGACQRACPLDIQVNKKPNSLECIRCGKCVASCPHSAICNSFTREKITHKQSVTEEEVT